MKYLVFTLFLPFAYSSYGQTTHYQNLIDIAFNGRGAVFVHSKPIKKIQLNAKEIWNYFDFHRDYANKVLDTAMFAQIILNSRFPDTTLWQENELKDFLLVVNRNESISRKYALQKLAPKNKTKFYRKQGSAYNFTDPYSRNLFYFSRPVFDNSKKFAVVQWDNAHSGLGGGGGIILFHFQGNTRKELGLIINWKY